MSRLILHCDLDCFFAAVEERDKPEYIGKPVIIGADPKGGKGRGTGTRYPRGSKTPDPRGTM